MMAIPLQFYEVQSPSPILTIGVLAVLLYACLELRSPLALALWGMSVVIMLLSGLASAGADLFWVGTSLTAIVLTAAAFVRWSR